MQLIALSEGAAFSRGSHRSLIKKTWLIMKMTIVLLTIACFQVSAKGYTQSITLAVKNAPLEKVFKELKKQTGYDFWYETKLLRKAERVDIEVKNTSLKQALDECFRDQPFTYTIIDKIIVVKSKPLTKFASEIPTATEAIPQLLIDIHGTITDDKRQPLAGATILVKGTSIGTKSDTNGSFSINAEPSSTLIISFVGFESTEVKVGNRTNITVQLKPSVSVSDEVVVIGYGTAKKSDLTGSVASIKADDFENQPMTQMTEMLSGTVAGFNSDQSTGAAGGGSMQIRGPKSLNASTSPMIVVDGSIYNGSLSDINPSDIETIDILKDASSAAVYGARAAAGVVLVTTKKGKLGKPVINASAQVSSVGVTHAFKPYDKDGYLTFREDVLRGYYPQNPSWYYTNPEKLPTDVSRDQWRNASNNPQSDNTKEWLKRLNFFDIETENYLSGKYVDWYDEVIRTGSKQDYGVSISGGTKAIKYYWSLGYQDNKGVIRGDQFSILRSRLNLEANITPWLKAGTNLQISQRDQDAVPASLSQMFIMSPYGSMYEPNGDIKWYPNGFATPNPLIDYYGRDRYQRSHNIFATLYSEVKLPFGIKYRFSFQPRVEYSRDYNFYSSKTITGGSSVSGGYATRSESAVSEYILDHLISWNKVFGAHKFDVTLLSSLEANNGWNTTSSNQTFVPNENLAFHGLQYGTNPGVTSNDTRLTGDALMGRLNYTYNDKYLLTMSLRRDGYSDFGVKNPTALFPAAAFAWVVSNEKFFKSDLISRLKLRTSWGANGNRDIGAYAALAQLASVPYYNGSQLQVGVTPSTLANYDLKWERTTSANVGIDLEMLNGKVRASIDAYDMTTTNLLMNRLLPRITGYSSVTSNLGELGNKGMEVSIETINKDNENFKWSSGFVFSFNRNKIKKLFGDFEEYDDHGTTKKREVPDYSNEWFPGQALDRVWGYEITGIWQKEEADEAKKYGLSPGDFKVVDPTGDYKYAAIQDKQFIGYSAPRYRIGFRNDFTLFKNLTVSMFLRSDLGHIGAFTDGKRAGGSDTYDRRNTSDFPYWTSENRNNEYPRLNTNTTVFGGGIDMYFSRSFLRVQDLSIAYDFPKQIFEKYGLTRLKAFVAARNLATIHGWPKWDPESPDSPMPKTFSAGLNISL
jgi:TonB-linked SusC/RagA family outer membrane protein